MKIARHMASGSVKRTIFVLSLVLLACCKDSQREERPNVIMIMSDDQGYGDFSLTISKANIEDGIKWG